MNTIIQATSSRSNQQAARARQLWTREEEKSVRQQLLSGESIDAVAGRHQRSHGSIAAKAHQFVNSELESSGISIDRALNKYNIREDEYQYWDALKKEQAKKTPRRGHSWTDQEDSQLDEEIKQLRLNYSQIAELHGRTEWAVRLRACELVRRYMNLNGVKEKEALETYRLSSSDFKYFKDLKGIKDNHVSVKKEDIEGEEEEEAKAVDEENINIKLAHRLNLLLKQKMSATDRLQLLKLNSENNEHHNKLLQNYSQSITDMLMDSIEALDKMSCVV